MAETLDAKELKNESGKNGPENGKDKLDKERIQRVKKHFLPSWTRGAQNQKPKLSSEQ
ncbi:MAG TPA: hypothetical protein VMT04_10910 [Terriglobales bacterium]|nr:hypothetical protein [Terriglobales bacterium]